MNNKEKERYPLHFELTVHTRNKKQLKRAIKWCFKWEFKFTVDPYWDRDHQAYDLVIHDLSWAQNLKFLAKELVKDDLSG